MIQKEYVLSNEFFTDIIITIIIIIIILTYIYFLAQQPEGQLQKHLELLVHTIRV